jgi:succinate-acetate transporter protein
MLFVGSFSVNLSGYGLFAIWAIQCAIASARRDLFVWLVFTFVPLSVVAATWPSTVAMIDDPFGVKMGTIALFSGMCVVAAMTCTLALVRPYAAQARQQLEVKE